MTATVHLAAVSTDRNFQLALRVLPALAVILAVSAICGRLAQLINQPRVFGEMVAGVLLGPTLFGWVAPSWQAALFPSEVKPVLYILSTIGLTLYMFLVGAGMEHGTSVRGEGRQAAVLAVSGMLPSLLLGGAVGLVFWQSLSKPDVGRLEFALFLGGALSITAFPMLARILYELGIQKTHLGRLTLVAASIDDVSAWCLLAVLSAIGVGSTTDAALRTIGLGAVFGAVMLLGVSRLLKPLSAGVARTGKLSNNAMYVVVLVPLVAGFVTDWIGVYSVFGGFIAGLAMPRDAAFITALHDRMMDVVSTLLLPVFFTLSGLNTQLGGLSNGGALLAFAVILLAGFVGKYFGCALAMRGLGFDWRRAYAVGGLMNARGLIILIFINIGLAQGIINGQVFAMLVLVAVITTVTATPLYRMANKSAAPREETVAVGSPT